SGTVNIKTFLGKIFSLLFAFSAGKLTLVESYMDVESHSLTQLFTFIHPSVFDDSFHSTQDLLSAPRGLWCTLVRLWERVLLWAKAARWAFGTVLSFVLSCAQSLLSLSLSLSLCANFAISLC